MATYFGKTTVGGTSTAIGNIGWQRNKSYVTGFACPGSGNQIVKDLSFYCQKGAAASHLQLGVFDASRNLICQGTAEVALTATAGWQGHLTQADITPNPAILIGGVTYYLASSIDQTDVNVWYDAGAADAWTAAGVDYTGGFPASLADGVNAGVIFSIRCGVDPAVPIPIAMADFRRFRG